MRDTCAGAVLDELLHLADDAVSELTHYRLGEDVAYHRGRRYVIKRFDRNEPSPGESCIELLCALTG